jgi:hypothetical protein
LAVAVLTIPAAATPAARVAVQGAASGSHLQLSTSGSNVIVKGTMATAQPRGCRFAQHHRLAICPGDADAMEIEMGDADDFVVVHDRLPFPLTVRLGSGEDKFIGNAENDTCYPEGSRRNRCIGGAGDDTCITGSRNSDCVGGPGDDYCRASTGSDGCWGGPGDDVCYMGPGQDGCHGESGNDRLFGEFDADQLYGGEGIDFCDGGPGVGYSHECESGPRR